ncbi:hypothetical protein AUJ10_02630 [Candidatus Pacearchaeota archaeon CG1_02_31_27]|nr:MAG: hypothetical protein AUJ10_02630 [Candidatus Pacearchaeota archaeon CG1_02_31_27]
MKTNKYIFWRSKSKVGVCSTQDWVIHSKEYDIKPIVMSILECSDQYINELMELLKNDPKKFQKEVLGQIRDDLYKILM